MPERARTSLRWFAQAHAEQNRSDAFVKFWVALEALAFDGKGSPVPFIELLANFYEQDTGWARDTFAINQLAQLRNEIVHQRKTMMLHGNLLRFVSALYIDGLRARLKLSNEKRAERALPEGKPFVVRNWRNSGEVPTVFLPGETE